MPTNINYTLKEKENTRYYVPINSGTIDVVSDMAWTLTPPGSREQYNNRVPFMSLTEYQQSTGQLIASIIYFARVGQRLFETGRSASGLWNADADPSEVYKLKYFGEPTGFKYRLPYFNPAHTKRGNTFGGDENPFSSLISLSKDITAFFPKSLFSSGVRSGSKNLYSNLGLGSAWADTAISLINQAIPGKIKFEYPQAWNETSPESYSTSFDLFNTGDLNQAIQNRRFCHLISYQNSPSRRNFAIMDPPVIYSLSIPGIVNLPVCYVNDLGITNLGNTRVMYIDNKEVLIPEAYRISLSFQSLLLPTRNIMLAVESGNVVEGISDLSPSLNQANELINSVRTFGNNPQTSSQPNTTPEVDAFPNVNLRNF